MRKKPLILYGVIFDLCHLSTIGKNLGIAAKLNWQFENNYNPCEDNRTCIDLAT